MNCIRCAAPGRATDKYCHQCGARHERAPDAASADRRVVTVLCTDISGFTSMSERLPPETVAEVVNSLFQVLTEPVYRFGGVVDKYIGDAVMALFGAPIAHEDDAERAVRAAFETQQAAAAFAADLERRTGLALRLRIGLHTGLVYAGAVGAAQRAGYSVLGEAVHVAQRMEAGARPGHVLVSPATHQQVAGSFDFRGQGAGYELVGLRESSDRPGARLFGREDELKALGLAWECCHAGEPRVLWVVGDAGVGKSALVQRFLAGLGERPRIVRARALSFEQQSGHALLARLLRGLLELPEAASEEALLAPLSALMGRLLPGAERSRVLIRHLLNLDVSREAQGLTPRQLQTAAFVALSDLLLGLSREHPLILSLEDLQWADEASLAWIETLQARLETDPEGARLLLLAELRRGEGEVPGPVVSLGPLSGDHAMAIARAQLGGATVLSEPAHTLLERLVAKAEGNPFYLEELVRTVLERGALIERAGCWELGETSASALLPDSVRSVVAARLDGLPPTARDVLQTGAVIGRRFGLGVLTSLLERDARPELPALSRSRLLSVRESDLEFVQSLVHEVAYDGLLRARRRELHRRLAEILEAELLYERSPLVDALAYHYVQAEEAPRACWYLFLAGRRAEQAGSSLEAREAYRSALAWLDRAGAEPGLPTRQEIVRSLTQVETTLGNLDEARRLVEESLEEGAGEAALWLVLSTVLERQGELSAAELACQEALALAHPGSLDEARGLALMGNLRRRAGEYGAAIDLSIRAGARFVALGRAAEAAYAHGVVGLCHHRMGDWQAALAEHGEALRLREQSGDHEGAANSHNNLGIIHAGLGAWEEASEHYAAALRMFRKLGNRLSVAMLENNLGDLLLRQGDVTAAEPRFQEALRLSVQLGNVIEELTSRGNLAEVALARGQGDAALASAERCLELAGRIDHQEFVPELHGMRARALATLGRFEEARAALQLAATLSELAGNEALQGILERHGAELELAAGNPERALAHARCSEERLRAGGHALELARTLALVARLAVPGGAS